MILQVLELNTGMSIYFQIKQFIEYSLSRRIMKILVKSNSSPILNPQPREASQLAKPRKYNLQQLENEVNKSRIAIQNMSHTNAIQSCLYKKVSELQKELQHCILSINHEEEKQKILQELNHLLKSQMSQFQAAQRTEDELMCSSYEKKIKKVEYDIKQILHKYNEEIAKINWLKEQANSARDQRVVYSNLFNKIEKEIKHYEQFYRQTLIKNQIFLDQKRIVISKNSKEIVPTANDPVEQTTDPIFETEQKDDRQTQGGQKSRKEVKIKANKKSILKTQKLAEQDLFITNLKQSTIRKRAEKTQKNLGSSYRDQPSQNRYIEQMIHKKEARIKTAIALTQCRSLQQVLYTYGSLQQSNQNLTTEILQIDQNISQLQQEIQIHRKQKRASQAYENRQLSEMLNISKKSKSNKWVVTYSQSAVAGKPAQQMTIEICKLLGVQCQNLGNDVLRQVDRRIDELGCNHIVERRGRRDSRLISAQQMSNGERGVSQILEKIEKFGESQKIFDRNMLRAQYQKEVSKVKKRGKKII